MKTINVQCPVCNQLHANTHVTILDYNRAEYVCPVVGQLVTMNNFVPGAPTLILSNGQKTDFHGDALPVIAMDNTSTFYESVKSVLNGYQTLFDQLNEIIYLGLGGTVSGFPKNQGIPPGISFSCVFTTPSQSIQPSNVNSPISLPPAFNVKIPVGAANQTSAPDPSNITLTNKYTVASSTYYYESDVQIINIPANTTVNVYDPNMTLRVSGFNSKDGGSLTLKYPLQTTSGRSDQGYGTIGPDQFGQPSGVDHVYVSFTQQGQVESAKTIQYFGSGRITSGNLTMSNTVELDITLQYIKLNYYGNDGSIVSSDQYGGMQTLDSGTTYILQIDYTYSQVTAKIWKAKTPTLPITLTVQTNDPTIMTMKNIYLTHTNLIPNANTYTSGWSGQFDPAKYGGYYLIISNPCILTHVASPATPIS